MASGLAFGVHRSGFNLFCGRMGERKQMKGIVLAGGTGSRLYPLTKITNKHLLPVYDRPMIYYPIQTLVDAGIRDILMVTGGQEFRRLSASARQWQGIRPEALELCLPGRRGRHRRCAGAGRALRRRRKICVILGDNIIEGSIRAAVEDFQRTAMRRQNPAQGSARRRALRRGRDLPDGQIVGIEEKPKHPKSNYAVTGIYMYDATVFDKIRELVPSRRGELEITDVNNAYIGEGTLIFSLLEGWWTDAGTFESLLRASNLVAGNAVAGRTVSKDLVAESEAVKV